MDSDTWCGKKSGHASILLRRDRLVVGGPGKGYESREILGAPNSSKLSVLWLNWI